METFSTLDDFITEAASWINEGVEILTDVDSLHTSLAELEAEIQDNRSLSEKFGCGSNQRLVPEIEEFTMERFELLARQAKEFTEPGSASQRRSFLAEASLNLIFVTNLVHAWYCIIDKPEG